MIGVACHPHPDGGFESGGSGQLFYVMGASGAGKDTVLEYARRNLPPASQVLFAHRYITRPMDYGAENHIALTDDEYTLRLHNCCFIMNWQSHGFSYGIGTEIANWLYNGLSVVVSGSREYFKTALVQFPGIKPILITASQDTICKRLVQRGREDIEKIRMRLVRNNRFTSMHKEKIYLLENEGEPYMAGNELIRIILEEKLANVSNS